MNDLRFAFRQLLKNPGFTAVAVLTLALGIGANTTIYALVHYVLLRPGPGTELDHVVSFARTQPGRKISSGHSYPEIMDYREQGRDIFAGVAGYTFTPGNVTIGGQTERMSVGLVTEDYFSLLGIHPLVGRGFLPEEGRTREAHPVAVVSSRLWRKVLEAGAAAIESATVRINNHEFIVVGVIPDDAARMARVLRVDVFVPAVMEGTLQGGPSQIEDRRSRQFLTAARLKPAVTLQQAQAACDLIANRMSVADPEGWRNDQVGVALRVVPEAEARVPMEIHGQSIGVATTLFIVVGLVLLIACANLANFLLARAVSRRQEIAVRLALGAGRWRLIRQLLTENFLLALLGAAGGVLLCFGATNFIRSFHLPSSIPLALDVQMHWQTLGFAMALAVAATLLFGLTPALQAARVDLLSSLKGKEIVVGHRLFSYRNLLIVGQVTASLTLLTGAGLFLNRLLHAEQVDFGFQPRGIALLAVNLQTDGYTEPRARQFCDEAIQRLRAVAGVKGADISEFVPLGMDARKRSVNTEGGERGSIAWVSSVGAHYLSTMEIGVVRGRNFTDADRSGAVRVAIINEALATALWPGENPVGHHFRDWNDEVVEVVGVTRNGKYHTPEDTDLPYIYLPWKQHYAASFTFVVKTESDPAPMLGLIRRELLGINRNLSVFDVRTMKEHLALALLPRRIAASFFTSLGVLGLCLATVGLYGVAAYAVSQRTREIGIRIALGAQNLDVMRLVLSESMKLIAIGITLGVVVSFIGSQIVTSQVFGIAGIDAGVFGTMALLLAAVATFACWLPARRASKVDPMVALRNEG